MDRDLMQMEFPHATGYLNTASVGLGPTSAATAIRAALDDWEEGRSDPPAFDGDVARARRSYAQLTGVDSASVALVSQVSVASALVAASLPDGARVLCAEEDFASVLFPFLGDQRLQVRAVPLDTLIDHIDEQTDLVAVSAVQSADGRAIDLDALATAAQATETKTFVDTSQAAGWVEVGAGRFDVTAAGAYKWLLAPRGSGFVTVSANADWLRPLYPGWYSSPEPWDALYGLPLRLAPDARRFDASPAWFDIVGAARSLELLERIGVGVIHDHSVGLANQLRTALGMDPSDSAIVSLATDRSAALAGAGIKGAVRAGQVRLSFYLYNTVEDVARVAAVLA